MLSCDSSNAWRASSSRLMLLRMALSIGWWNRLECLEIKMSKFCFGNIHYMGVYSLLRQVTVTITSLIFVVCNVQYRGAKCYSICNTIWEMCSSFMPYRSIH